MGWIVVIELYVKQITINHFYVLCHSISGGTLKIYGESLCRDVPYKTLLLSIRDCAQAVVREMLSKYGLDKTDPLHYCLVQVNSDGTEYILDDDECPLSILMNHPTSRGESDIVELHPFFLLEYFVIGCITALQCFQFVNGKDHNTLTQMKYNDKMMLYRLRIFEYCSQIPKYYYPNPI